MLEGGEVQGGGGIPGKKKTGKTVIASSNILKKKTVNNMSW